MAVFFDNESSTPILLMSFHLSNTFRSGETFWGFTAGTEDKSNEQIVYITEVKNWNKTVPLLDTNNGSNCDTQLQEIKCSYTITSSTVNVPNIVDAGYCGMYPGRYGGLLYTISVLGHKPATLLNCNDDTDFDTKIQVFQDIIVGKCVAGNGGDHNCGVNICVTFNAVETETYIPCDSIWIQWREIYTFGRIWCQYSWQSKNKKKDRRNRNEDDECPQCGLAGCFTFMVLFGIYPNKLNSRHFWRYLTVTPLCLHLIRCAHKRVIGSFLGALFTASWQVVVTVKGYCHFELN